MVSVVSKEVNDAFFDVFDDCVLHDVVLRRLGSSHLQDASQLSLRPFVLLNQIDVSVLDDLRWVAQHFYASLNPSDRLRNVVKVCITGLATGLLAYLLETRQAK